MTHVPKTQPKDPSETVRVNEAALALARLLGVSAARDSAARDAVDQEVGDDAEEDE